MHCVPAGTPCSENADRGCGGGGRLEIRGGPPVDTAAATSLLDLDQGTNIEYRFTPFVRNAARRHPVSFGLRKAASTGPRSVFAWNLVDFKRVCWEGPKLTPGKHQLEFDFKYDGLGAVMMAFGVIALRPESAC